jgi:large-conductance mechanosensitive channel
MELNILHLLIPKFILATQTMHENLDRIEEIKVASNRSFGIVFTLVFLVMGIWQILAGKSLGWYFFASAIFFFIATITFSSLLGPFNRAWFKFGLLLGQAVNPIILGFVFFLVVTPIGIVRRLLGKDSLHLKPRPNLKSYWIDRNPPGPKLGSMTKQF